VDSLSQETAEQLEEYSKWIADLPASSKYLADLEQEVKDKAAAHDDAIQRHAIAKQKHFALLRKIRDQQMDAAGGSKIRELYDKLEPKFTLEEFQDDILQKYAKLQKGE